MVSCTAVHRLNQQHQLLRVPLYATRGQHILDCVSQCSRRKTVDLPVQDITGPAVYFESFQGKIDVLKGCSNFPNRISFLPLTSCTFSSLRSIMHLHCRSGLKTSAILTRNDFIPHNLRRREQFYTWCGRRARTGTCLQYTEDIFRSALNFTQSPSSKVINNLFAVSKYRPRLLIEIFQLMLQLKQFKLTRN